MGSVGFPIDIVFFDGGGVARKIVTASPGAPGMWSYSDCSAVLETPGGFCRSVGFRTGAPARLVYDQPFTTQRELTDDPNRTPPEERYKDRQDASEASPDAMQGLPSSMWEQDIGYSQLNPEYREHEGPALRPVAQMVADPGAFVAGVVEAIARDTVEGRGIRWQPETLTAGKVESAVVTADDLGSWLEQLNVAGQDMVMKVATSPEGLRTIGDGLVLAGIADLSRVIGDKIALWRGTR
jgi:hypothetical protein